MDRDEAWGLLGQRLGALVSDPDRQRDAADALSRLQDPNLPPDQERHWWTVLNQNAPGLLEGASGWAASVMSAALRGELGLD